MVKRAFKNHRLTIILVAINSVIVFEEFAHQHWYPPPRHIMGLGWYWTLALSFPSSLLLFNSTVNWPWSSEALSLLGLLFIGAFQWGIIGALLDRSRRGRSSAKT
jgi:hypothetical protein